MSAILTTLPSFFRPAHQLPSKSGDCKGHSVQELPSISCPSTCNFIYFWLWYEWCEPVCSTLLRVPCEKRLQEAKQFARRWENAREGIGGMALGERRGIQRWGRSNGLRA